MVNVGRIGPPQLIPTLTTIAWATSGSPSGRRFARRYHAAGATGHTLPPYKPLPLRRRGPADATGACQSHAGARASAFQAGLRDAAHDLALEQDEYHQQWQPTQQGERHQLGVDRAVSCTVARPTGIVQVVGVG